MDVFEAVKNNDIEAVEQYLEKGGDPDLLHPESQITAHTRTPLIFFAAERGRSEIVKLLIEKGADIHIKKYDESTLLHYAARGGLNWLIEDLLEKGFDIHASDWGKRDALYEAAATGRVKSVELLIEKGADVKVRYKHDSSILHHVYNAEVAEVLIQNEARVNAVDTDGESPLFNTAKVPEVIEVLLNHGADPNVVNTINGFTPLLKQLFYRNENSALLLIEHGADIHYKTPDNQNSMHMAARSNCLKVAKILIQKNVDVNLQDRTYKTTPLHSAARHGHVEFAQVLLENNADATLESAKGQTPVEITEKEKIEELILSHFPQLKNKVKNTNAYIDETIQKLKEMDYFKYVDSEKIPEVVEEIRTNIKQYGDIMANLGADDISFNDKRTFFADSERLSQGEIPFVLKSMKPVLEKAGVEIDKIENNMESAKSYSITIDGQEYLIYNEKSDVEPQSHSLKRTLEIINEFLMKADSKERVYGAGSGNDTQILLLNDKLYKFFKDFYKDKSLYGPFKSENIKTKI